MDKDDQSSDEFLDTESDEEKIALDDNLEFAADYDGPRSRRRFYQSIRDYSLYKEGSSVMENYMEIVIQFGYVVLFG